MREWEEFLLKQEGEFGRETVDRWLRTLLILRFDACNIYLQAKDSFQSSWFDEHIRPKLTSFTNCNNKAIKVHLEIAGQLHAGRVKPGAKKPKDAAPAYQLYFDTKDPSFSFDNFIQNEENQVAKAILEECCTKLVDCKLQAMSSMDPQKTPSIKELVNPIFLYGPSGSGKTHLLQAFCQKLERVGYKAIYVRAETFTDHVIKAIRAGNMAYFRQFYRSIDALVIDDVQHLTKKNATQEEFFHTFNALHTDGKMIVLSSHCTPGTLQHIEPRLISRFEWGITLPLSCLNKKEIEQMVEKKAATLKFPITARIASFLAETFTSNPKSTIQALEALMLRSHLTKGVKPAHTTAYVKQLLSDLIEKERTEELSCERILTHVSTYYGVLPDDLIGKSQNREFSLPRQLAIYLCRDLLKIPYMKIGDLFHRDHSTIMSSIKLLEKEIRQKESSVAPVLNELKHQLTTQPKATIEHAG